jgi:magnesium transporter
MYRTLLYRPEDATLESGGAELIATWRAAPGSLLWLDLADNPAQEEAQLLVEEFGLHRLAVQDAQRARHQPKVEFFERFVFVLLKGLGADAKSFEFKTIQIAMFIGEGFLVTRHSGPSPSIERLREEVIAEPARCAVGADGLALALSKISVDRYIDRLLTLEPRLEQLEHDIVERPHDALLAELLAYKTDLRQFRRVLSYHVGVFNELLRHSSEHVGRHAIHETRDVYEHQERASGLATLYFDMASDLVEGYISLSSHRLNNIMKVLTIITAIFVPLGFLAGIYGMNFENIPELKSPIGYFVLLGVMATIAGGLLLVFRRKGWL